MCWESMILILYLLMFINVHLVLCWFLPNSLADSSDLTVSYDKSLLTGSWHFLVIGYYKKHTLLLHYTVILGISSSQRIATTYLTYLFLYFFAPLLPSQLLFQAIKIYTVSRCTYKNYQNLPGIVKDVVVNNNNSDNNNYKSALTLTKSKSSTHDKLPDVRTGALNWLISILMYK